ncbi:MAG TPA: hypothetical protein V6D12_14190 [Candidatus Obscuribacterales bacterium]
MRQLLLIILLLISSSAYAGTVSMPQYNANDTLTDLNLNLRWNLLSNEINGGLDNTNADTAGGFRFHEILGSLPAAGNQGRVVFLTANNTLNFDTGSDFVQVPAITGAVGGTIVQYNGSTWIGTNPGTIDYPFVSNGSGNTGAYEQLKLTTAVQGQLPLANGGTAANLTDPNADRILFWDDSAGQVTFLTAGTGLELSGTTLTTTHKLVSTTSVSTATASSDISITNTKYYLVNVVITATSATTSGFGIRFNSGVSTNTYGYIYRGFDLGGTAQDGAVTLGSAAYIQTNATAGVSATTDTYYFLQFYIYPQSTLDQKHQTVRGTTWGRTNSGNDGYSEFMGSWNPSASTVTDFRIITTDGATTYSGTIYLYEIPLS